ncbi:MAG: 2Fe-2S iron-sulfur cluster-binding protein [Candidatus Peribacteraceae bacterium]|nr:2Fe-2S iron-sulfur cluster-binding protein [Candidatus Peribacteraceae bacterium]MDD5074354.1 2Fe-2S iron-sulfur cluster-binding protein [Candidatus Peribacteraceae bacterium]
MPKITFIVSGKETVIDAEAGKSVLEVAQAHGIPMEAACGGNGFCATCKCKISKGMENASPRNDREEGMGVTEGTDRLGCQTVINGDMTVEL